VNLFKYMSSIKLRYRLFCLFCLFILTALCPVPIWASYSHLCHQAD